MAYNLDSSGFSFGGAGTSGGSGFNFGSFDGAFDSVTGGEGGQTFVGDVWNGSLGFLRDGLNVYRDYLDIKGGSLVPASGSRDQWAEQAQPVDTRSMATAPGGQIIPGVGNGILLLAGAALAVVLLTK